MNLFLKYKKSFLLKLKLLNDKKLIILPAEFENITVESSPKIYKSDISCNASMVLAKINKKSPIELGELLKQFFLEEFQEFESIEIVKPGFLNITFKADFWKKYLLSIYSSKADFGSYKVENKKYNIEFVSANPTGPLHVGHCRGAIIGDAISNLLRFNGNAVVKEYYVNDSGNQINNFVLSIYYRILEITEKRKFPLDKDLYPGDYIIDISNSILNKKSITNFKDYKKIYTKLAEESLKVSMHIIKSNLISLGVNHDNFVYESSLIENNLVSKTIDELKKEKFVYKGKLQPPKGESIKNWKSRDQLLFNSTKFGDDSDRAIKKDDDTWTYFASDIAYHKHKIDRNFDVLINILGADHAGYIKRISAAVKALSKNKKSLQCKVSQLVKLYKKGIPFKMSKRKGDYITVADLVNEVGIDSVRFMMLNRSNDVELDFDFEKVTEKSKDNPVFYVQYAYARINSIFKTLNLNISSQIKINEKDFSLNKFEIDILKKISEWPKCVEITTLKLEPHRIPYYLYDLATLFHSYWNLGKENTKYRFVSNDNKQNNSRLLLIQAISIVIEKGMSILGVSTPKSM